MLFSLSDLLLVPQGLGMGDPSLHSFGGYGNDYAMGADYATAVELGASIGGTGSGGGKKEKGKGKGKTGKAGYFAQVHSQVRAL